jgi:putative ABC transport system substrate-binding protein
MRLIGLAVVLAVSLTLAPLAAETQQAVSVPRVGFLSPSSLSEPRTPRYLEAFRQGLRELGYVEGQSIAIELRWAEGKYDRLPALAAELVRLQVNVIVTYSEPAIRAAKQATERIPIVMAAVADPVASGFVASLARPGGNITGISNMRLDLTGKQLELLREVVPKVSRVAILGNAAIIDNTLQVRHAQDAARALGMRLQPLLVRSPGEIDPAFAAMTTEGAGALIVLVDTMLLDSQSRIADLAVRWRLPMVFSQVDQAEAGGLMAYGPSVHSRFRRSATYVDKILKGAKPADLPVEQPTKFELVINMKTAKALGLTIPQTLLLRADEVIE